MVGIVPFQKALNHGFFNYQPIFFSDLAVNNNYELELFWSVSSRDIYTINLIDYSTDLLHQYAELQRVYKRDNHYGGEEELGYIMKKKTDNDFSSFSQVYNDNYSLSEEKRNVRSINNKFNNKEIEQLVKKSNSFLRKTKKLIHLCIQGNFKSIFYKIFK